MNAPRKLPGMLLRSPASEFGDRVFYVENGRRHWVRDGVWLRRHGFRWPDDVRDVPPDMLYSFANGSAAPVCTPADLAALGVAATSTDLREIAAAGLCGTGIEFGSGASPFPVPLHCHTLYADAYSYDNLRAHLYPGQTLNQIVRPDYVTDLQSLAGVGDSSLDFIVACHVIEHTRSPVTAIKSCYRALRPGGSLVLVVPDMRKTFDRAREQTTLAHLVEDDRSPSAERDLGHFEEFYSRVFPLPPGEDVKAHAAARQAEGTDIHYHCWTDASFADMVHWTCIDGAPWSRLWSHPTLPGPEEIEFYFVLGK